MTKTTRREEVRKVRLFFFVFRLASRRAPRVASVGHVVDEDTHKFGFPQISRDREDCETTDTLGARADAARDARFVFSSFSGFALPRRARQKNANRNDVLFAGDEATEGRFSETPFAVPELQSYPARFVWMPS
jgi:hypothetical protein